MADLSITMHGDASGAGDALKHVGHEASALHEVLEGALKGALGSTVTTFSALETAAEKAAEVVKDFFKESIEDYAKAEKASNQLRAAAGSLTGAFEEQAEAMERSLHVKAQDIEHMQMLLLRYGAAPAQIEETTKAVLDFAAATGQDANSALMMMIRGVENGHGSLGRMGVQFKATGDFAKDLGTATEALSEKFGGAADVDAHGLAGRTHGVGLAMEALRINVGHFFDDLDRRLGLLDSMTKGIQKLADAVKAINQDGWGGLFSSMGLKQRNAGGDEAQAAIGGAAWGVHLNAPGERVTFGGPGEGLGDKPLFENDEKQKTSKEAVHKSMLQLEAEYQRKHRDLLIENFEKDLKDEETHDDEILKGKEKLYDAEAAMQAEAFKAAVDSEEAMTKALFAEVKRQQDDLIKLSDITIDSLKSQNQQFEEFGRQVGTAIVLVLQDAIDKARKGVTQDINEDEALALDLTEVSLETLGSVLGEIYGGTAGGYVGGAAGLALGMAVRTVYTSHKYSERTKGDFSDNGGRPFHEGGWIERYHSGGWPMRQMDLTSGGPPMGISGGIGRGDGGCHVRLTSLDARSLREVFESGTFSDVIAQRRSPLGARGEE